MCVIYLPRSAPRLSPAFRRVWAMWYVSYEYKRVRCDGGSSTSLATSRTYAAMGIQPRTRSGLSRSILVPETSMTKGGSTTARILLILFLVSLECLTSVGAANLIQCGERLRDAQQGALNATNSTSPPPLLHLSYAECVAECGGGTGDVNWSQFSQSFGAWFLPWVALMFQIPFGAECTCHFSASLPFGVLTRDSQLRSKTSSISA